MTREPHPQDLDVPPAPGAPGFPAEVAPAAVEEERRGGCGGCLAKLFALALALVLAAAAGGYLLHRWRTARFEEALDAARGAIRIQGYPSTLQELDDWYERPPEGRNAADVLARAFRLYGRSAPVDEGEKLTDPGPPPEEVELELPRPGEILSPGKVAALRAWLAVNRESLEILRGGTGMARCRYPVDFTNVEGYISVAYVPDMSHMSSVVAGAKLLRLEAILRAEDGDARGALASAGAGLRLGATLFAEPSIHSYYKAAYCRRLALEGLSRALSRTRPAEEDLSAIAAVLGDAELAATAVRAVAGERALGLDAFSRGVDAFPPQDRTLATRAAMAWYVMRGRLGEDLGFYLDVMDEAVRLSSEEFPGRIASAEALLARIDSLGSPADGKGPMIFSSGLLRGDMEFFFRPVPEDVARIRAAGVAVAIKRYALVSGILPHRLDTMAPDPLPAVPADPYDGRPLRYRRTDGEYVVYSVGPDGRDDGGDAGKDIAVRVRH